MKKTLICTLLLALALLIFLAGCGGVPETVAPVGAPAQASASPSPVPAEASPAEAPEPGPEDPAPAESPAPEETPDPADETVYVSTAGELLEAIAPGAVIELAPGTYNITEALREASDDISEYVVRSFSSDGWQAGIRDVGGLTIRGAESGLAEVVAEPRYSDVLHFSACSDIAIENVTLGHTIEQGNCEGAVLAFDRCRNIRLERLDLYGCGTYGVEMDRTAGVTVKDSVIRECSYGIVDLRLCSDAVFEGCDFRDNGGFDMLSLSGSFVRFDGCAFSGNEGSSFLPSYYYRGSESGARFERCSFDRWESQRLGAELKGQGSFVIGKDCRFKVEPGKRTVRVSDMEEMIENIAPDTLILLAPGRYDLSETLSGLYDREGAHFNESRQFVRIEKVYDGLELVVTGVSGLTIASESGSAADTEIVTDPRYADVLRFENCSGTGMMDLTMGHTDTGECAGDVLCFSHCSDTVLRGMDLYGCGVYGVSTDECALFTCFDSTIRDCEYGAVNLYAAKARQMFLNCLLTGSGSAGFLYADEEEGGEFYFGRCTFGKKESYGFAFNELADAEDCDWSEFSEDSEYYEVSEENYERIALVFQLDTERLEAVPFDAQLLIDEYCACYETVDRQSGEVSFETSDIVRSLSFRENGAGCFLTEDETERPFTYGVDSGDLCTLSFDDGGEGSVSLYADRGGAQLWSEEGSIWLSLTLDDEVLWFYVY